MPRVASLYPEYKISDLDTGGTTEYYGFVTGNGQWYILKLTGTQARYATGRTDYTTNWTNRATTVVYGRFDEVF